MRKVFIARGSYEYELLFQENGYEVVSDEHEADLICFTGGEDVDPHLYGEPRHRTTYPNMLRDVNEQRLYRMAIASNKPMVGICRGGQFLNVMCGGGMFQDVSKHAIRGTHTLYDLLDGDILQVTSTHHQMMKPGKDALVVAVAKEGGTRTVFSQEHNAFSIEQSEEGKHVDYEVICYEEAACLCFQPHPEFMGHEFKPMKEYFFRCIDMYLF